MIELNNVKSNTVVVIAGPTASGKSGLAMELARRYKGEIINADSMQVYQGMSLISAAPTAAEKNEIPHHLYEIYPPAVRGTVVDWLQRAVEAVNEVQKRERLPIVVGGTGLYIDNLINGTTPIPEPLATVREEVRQLLAAEGQSGLYARLKQMDPAGAARLNVNDTTRVRRACEIFLQTGISIDEWYSKPLEKKLPAAEFYVIKIIPAIAELDERCRFRFDRMMENGALEEVRRLLALRLDPKLPAMKMLGVPELAAYLQNEICLEQAVDLAKLHTRQYAKRQRTWFRNKLAAQCLIEHCWERQDCF